MSKISIIANNCIGAFVYQHYNQQYLSPFVGTMITSDDLVKIAEDPQRYLTKQISIVNPEEYDIHLPYPGCDKGVIGKIDDIFVYFTHDTDPDAVRENWSRRQKRIQWDKLLFVLAENEACSATSIKRFCELPVSKICLTYNDYAVVNANYYPIIKEKYGSTWLPRIVFRIMDWDDMILKAFEEI